jgi:membrane associated rhomboid family serine protease
MPARRNIELNFPPFTPGVIWLLGINTAIFLLLLLMQVSGLGSAVDFVISWFALRPAAVIHSGFIWQLVTYCFLHFGLLHYAFNMLGIWMFGSSFDDAWGRRRFYELFFFGVLGAGLFAIAVSYLSRGVLGSPNGFTIGASGGVYAILMAFGIVFGENEIILIPFPFRIKAKYFVAILVLFTAALSLQERGGISELAQMGGLLFGYVYVKKLAFRKRSRSMPLAERYYALRNTYYRWKRRRAAKKFQVYMKKHNREVYFDEYGNYKPPDDKKDDGETWVN